MSAFARRITYWTGWLSPEMEGNSSEVFGLTNHFRTSRVVGLSQHYFIKTSWRRRYFGLNVKLFPLFRVLAPLVDMSSAVNHVYGSLREWYFLRVLGRRPLVMTIATATMPFAAHHYARVNRFITHSNSTSRKLIRWGFDPAKISLIYPGVDLARFHPGPRPDTFPGGPATDPSRFRIVFASTPNWAEGIRIKGVDLLVAAARSLPDVDFYLLWRPLPGADALVETCRRDAPPNVHILTGRVADMTAAYQAADAVIAPFVTKTLMKICPTSLPEALACGRPVLASVKVGIADAIAAEQCGVTFGPTVPGLVRAIRTLQQGYAAYARRARPAAERLFDLEACCRSHEALYREVTTSC